MAEHDLSALDGLLDELDIEEKGSEDPRAAKLIALFEKAKATYTAKIDSPSWYIASSSASSNTTPFGISSFRIPSPADLLKHRKADRTGSTYQEWTANYLYTQGHFEKCLSYVSSFAVSMGIVFPFDGEVQLEEYDSSQLALRRSKQERELSKNWGIIKDVIDAGIRSLLTLRRTTPTFTSIETWIPDSASSYKWSLVKLDTLASGFLSFCMREVRVGAGDSRSGFSGMVVPSPESPDTFEVDMEKVKLQNWTVTHGLALTAGDLALEMGLYRTAIEAHSLFLACRGQMWRVLLALANEMSCYAQSLSSQGRTSEASLKALEVVAKASVVSALQAVPRPRRLELARLIMVEHRVIPEVWIDNALKPGFEEESEFRDEDDLLFNGLLQPLLDSKQQGWSVLPEEIGIALVKVVFAKKSGLFAIFSKFPTYMTEYKQRLEDAGSNKGSHEWGGELDAADEDDGEGGPRSVRTL
ncbi:uncharacterized protein UTRI_01881_B [Ustilago trichophora]|uniref:Uncharacterized protein n=1 Tax=Ustilago trichophora TaxID=86804 RepID=A0A5C3DXA6_9BASI|nr:uncharacterized protein UTRI_01881_B [Ustilago trichophora]